VLILQLFFRTHQQQKEKRKEKKKKELTSKAI
jgi:hypothetical protein